LIIIQYTGILYIMPRVSRVPIAKDVYKDLNDSFVDLISTLKDKSEIKRFLGDFLTREEKLMLEKRLALALMIKQGYRWEEIRQALRVSFTTINLMKHWISYKKGIEIGLNKLSNAKSSKKYGRKSEGFLRHIPPIN